MPGESCFMTGRYIMKRIRKNSACLQVISLKKGFMRCLPHGGCPGISIYLGRSKKQIRDNFAIISYSLA